MEECEYCGEALCPGTCQPEPGTVIALIGIGAISLLLVLFLAKLVI